MKKSIIVISAIVLLLAVAGVTKAQTHEFAPVGAEWYYQRLYREGSWNFTGVTYDRFRSLRTLEINGLECKEIEFYQHLDEYGMENPHTEFYYITQQEDCVYEMEDGHLLLLYDFGKEPGESWYAPKYNVTVYVEDVYNMELEDGSMRKVLETFVYDGYLYYNNIIEGIGLDMSLFPFIDLDGPPQTIHDYIRCYSENGVPLIVSETECDYEILSVNEQENNPLFQLNTLVENTLYIDFVGIPDGMKYVQITDMTGKTAHVQETTDKVLSINFSNKPNGVYLVQIITTSQVINKKIIKK